MNPLFYDKPVVLNASLHGKLKIRDNISRKFARAATAVPLTIAEFGVAQRCYPICFAGDTGQPVAILGVRAGENLFVDAAGDWKAGAYVPAYIRRYPFILVEAGEQVALAMENDEEVVAKDGGWALFEGEAPSALGMAALEFCRNYLTGVRQSDAFVKALNEAGLLVERRAAFEPNDGGRTQVGGFRIIDPEKLKALDGAVLADWNKRDWLGPIHAHLQSMSLWPEIFEEDQRRIAAKTPDAVAPGAKPAKKGKRGKLN